jgi:hypothetical protein
MRRLHSVAGQALHLLVLDVAKAARPVLLGWELAASHQNSTSEDDASHEPRTAYHGSPVRWQIKQPALLASAARIGSKPGPCGLIPHPPNVEWHCAQSVWE